MSAARPPANPYEAPHLAAASDRRSGAKTFKRLVIGLFAFFIAFWSGALAIFACAVLSEQGWF